MTAAFKLSMRSSKIGELIISQPARRNAIKAHMWESLPKILDEAQHNMHLRVLIVRGEGNHFSAGADISEFETLYKTAEKSRRISDHIAEAFKALADFPKPTIALIRGTCVGGGCGLALCCDIRLADNTARFAITPAKLGLVYPFEDVRRLIETVGIAHAKDMLFSARVIKARRAEKIGLINKLYKSDDVTEGVLSYADMIASLSSQSIQTMKYFIKAYQNGQFRETDETLSEFYGGFTSKDFQEGYKAFLEKRQPDFD